MRITNSMIRNTSRNNINNTKLTLDRAQWTMTNKKKIQLPSDDPIIAIRALKLRNNLNEITQYYERNAKDAVSWLGSTEGALEGLKSAINDMYHEYMRGANGTLEAKDRSDIKDAVVSLRDHIMKLCNTEHDDRNVFTGYKTSTSFTFEKDNAEASYDITQGFTGKDIESIEYISQLTQPVDRVNITSNRISAADAPKPQTVYRIPLGYQGLDAAAPDFSYMDTSQTPPQPIAVPVTVYQLNGTNEDAAYTTVAAGGANYIADTGELILSEDLYKTLVGRAKLPDGSSPITVTYGKKGFKEGEARPEMYFDCTDRNSGVEYTKQIQDIEYTINFGQKMKVNTEISDVVGRDLIRNVDDLVNCLQRVEAAQAKVDEADEMIKSDKYKGADLEALQSYLEAATKELDLQKDNLQKIMEAGVGQTQKYEQSVTIARNDLGNRKSRLELIMERLEDQQTNFKALKSANEDVNESDAILDMTAAKEAYDSALAATAQISEVSLLDYL